MGASNEKMAHMTNVTLYDHLAMLCVVIKHERKNGSDTIYQNLSNIVKSDGTLMIKDSDITLMTNLIIDGMKQLAKEMPDGLKYRGRS